MKVCPMHRQFLCNQSPPNQQSLFIIGYQLGLRRPGEETPLQLFKGVIDLQRLLVKVKRSFNTAPSVSSLILRTFRQLQAVSANLADDKWLRLPIAIL